MRMKPGPCMNVGGDYASCPAGVTWPDLCEGDWSRAGRMSPDRPSGRQTHRALGRRGQIRRALPCALDNSASRRPRSTPYDVRSVISGLRLNWRQVRPFRVGADERTCDVRGGRDGAPSARQAKPLAELMAVKRPCLQMSGDDSGLAGRGNWHRNARRRVLNPADAGPGAAAGPSDIHAFLDGPRTRQLIVEVSVSSGAGALEMIRPAGMW